MQYAGDTPLHLMVIWSGPQIMPPRSISVTLLHSDCHVCLNKVYHLTMWGHSEFSASIDVKCFIALLASWLSSLPSKLPTEKTKGVKCFHLLSRHFLRYLSPPSPYPGFQ